MLRKFWNDELGAVISAELVLVLTIAVVSMIVGLSEVAYGVVQELNDVGDSIGGLNQSYEFRGFQALADSGSIRKAAYNGSFFADVRDVCDNNQGDIVCNTPPILESPQF